MPYLIRLSYDKRFRFYTGFNATAMLQSMSRTRISVSRWVYILATRDSDWYRGPCASCACACACGRRTFFVLNCLSSLFWTHFQTIVSIVNRGGSVVLTESGFRAIRYLISSCRDDVNLDHASCTNIQQLGDITGDIRDLIVAAGAPACLAHPGVAQWAAAVFATICFNENASGALVQLGTFELALQMQETQNSNCEVVAWYWICDACNFIVLHLFFVLAP